MMTNDIESADQVYPKLLAAYRSDLCAANQRLEKLEQARRNATGAIAACVVAAFLWSSLNTYFLIAVAVLAVAVGTLNWFEQKCRREIAIAECGVWINRCGIARRARDWEKLPEQDVQDSLADSPLAIDLDLFGHASLMQLVCTAETRTGIDALSRWLVPPSAPEEIHQRQNVVRTLAPELSWRQELQRLCRVIAESTTQTQRLIHWGQEPPTLQLPTLVRWYALGLRLLLPVTLAVFLIHAAAASVMLAILVLANFLLTVGYSGQIHSFFREILHVPKSQPFSYLSDTFTHVRDSRETQQVLPETADTSAQAVTDLKRLERVLLLESIGGNPLTTAFIYIPLQFLLLWDLQMYMAAFDWQQATGKNLKHWFESLGEIEAICSLASLGFEQPNWVYPDVGQVTTETFASTGLGHPLLTDQSRIVNDVQIGPSGSLLLITGSNMGGKSTLLRAVGLNAVLAQAGAPCCCRSLQMPPLRVMTSMRVSDSLSDSTSLFMAQLLQMKTIVDYLRATQDGRTGVLMMYLFDEILNGTNTTDRRQAVEELVGYLLSCRAIGAMTTHDLEIATQSKYKAAFQTYYLAHQLHEAGEQPQLQFDYKLRRGVSPTSNAMLLVRLLGIPKGH